MGTPDDGERDHLLRRGEDTVIPISISSSRILDEQKNIWKAARKWWALSKMWFTASDERLKARAYAFSTAALSLATVFLMLKLSDVQSKYNSALSEKLQDDFYLAIWGFIGVVCIAAPLFAINDYVDNRLAIEWRMYLTRRLLRDYFNNQAYFRLKMDHSIDNPDQRICEDVRAYASTSVVLAIGILRQLFYCVAFTGLLYSLAPGLVMFLIVYAAVGTGITAAGFGRRLTSLSFLSLRQEADLRYEMVRIRESAESVAFYRADEREAATAGGRLEVAINTAREQAKVEAYLNLWQNIYAYATILIPALLMAPKYFAGEIRFGTIGQAAFAFNRIESALSYIISNLAALSALAAQTERLDSLITALDIVALQGQGGVRHLEASLHHTSPEVSVDKLTLLTPKGEQVLCKQLSFKVQPGQSLLIVGPSGSGKSSLLRALAGLWSNGSGTITTPHHSQTFFLPQKPYMPLGNLRQQLTFPSEYVSPLFSGSGNNTTTKTSTNANASAVQKKGSIQEDVELCALLDAVCLPHLLSRVGGLDAECEWAHVLSLGEQQRVAFLRLLRSRPAVAFLDEATSGVDTATEAVLYAALKAQCQAYVSIGHRKELVQHHTHVLECSGDGTWKCRTAAEHYALHN